ncbi:MAG: hypothetical protein QOJ65_455 [Fimbriimonadaceae bacterium]|jgi:hypothetical protein|nr:hypothetical protein [Fimbriimonadaceae bacterium]
MAQTILLVLASFSLGQTQTPAEVGRQIFTDHQDIADTIRLAITPKIDGTLEPEEWDPFLYSGDLSSFFQWEPRKLHFAAKAPIGDNVVFSIDLKNNGWLVGRDNLEVRLGRSEIGARISARVLDADNKSGPKWVDMPGIATASTIASTVSEDGKTWSVEATLMDPGTGLLPDGIDNVGIRVDPITIDATDVPSYTPRVLTQVKLGLKRSTGLPGGVYWEPQGEGQFVEAGRALKMRYTFKADNTVGFSRVSMRSEGFAKDATNLLEMPFPKFDKKNRAFVDYGTRVAEEAMEGYRIARCVITSSDGATAVGQASFRIPPPLEIDMVRESPDRTARPATIKMTVYLRSNSRDQMEGNLHIEPPTGFTVLTGNDNPFVVYKMGTARRVFEMTVPPNAVGTFPIDLTAKVGNKEFRQTAYLTIQY